MNSNQKVAARSQRGQSLTEVALVLPIMILIIAGLVEISNLIVSQSRLDAAVRRAARFGAQGGIDEGMRISMLQAVTPTLELDPTFWDVYVIRATVNAAGNGYVAGSWSFDPLYGFQNTRPVGSIDQTEVQNDILDNLNQQDASSALAANYEIVGLMAFHDVDSILGLDNYIRGLNTVRAFSVMRITPVPTARMTEGCQAFPLLVEEGARSLNTPTDFPAVADFEYPSEVDEIPALSDYYYAGLLPAPRSMLTADRGYVFAVPFNGASAGNTTPAPGTFDFARWDWFNVINMETALADSLTWPGNTKDSCADAASGDEGWEHPVLGCALDSDLHIDDPVRVSIANADTAGIKDELDEHISRGRTLRVMLFDRDDAPPPATGYGFGSDQMRKVSNFAIVRPLGYNLEPAQSNWILFEFVGLDGSCGVMLEPTPAPTPTPVPSPTPDPGPGLGCTLTQGYWKTHPGDWPLSSMVLGDVTYTDAEAMNILWMNPGGNGDMTIILATQLIAAKLNVANGADDSVVGPTIAAADAWLVANPLLSDPRDGARDTGDALKTILDEYNNGILPGGPPHCP